MTNEDELQSAHDDKNWSVSEASPKKKKKNRRKLPKVDSALITKTIDRYDKLETQQNDA